MLPKSKQFHPQHYGVIEFIRNDSFQLSETKATVIVTDVAEATRVAAMKRTS